MEKGNPDNGEEGMQVKKLVPQVLVTINPTTNQLQVNANFNGWDQIMAMLIDALRASNAQRMKEMESPIAMPQTQIILPGR